MKNLNLAKNAIIKKYHYIMSVHDGVAKALNICKDINAKRIYMAKSAFSKRNDIIVAVLKSIDAMITKEPDLWVEAKMLSKKMSLDIVKEINNLKGFYMEKPAKKKAKE